MDNSIELPPVPPLAVLQEYWWTLKECAGGLENIAAFVDRATAAGFDRGILQWLSKLTHEPTEGDRISLELTRS